MTDIGHAVRIAMSEHDTQAPLSADEMRSLADSIERDLIANECQFSHPEWRYVDGLRALAAAANDRRDLALRAFVKGAKWWEFEKEGATMWPSDQHKAYDAAVERYDRDPANAFLSPLEIAERQSSPSLVSQKDTR